MVASFLNPTCLLLRAVRGRASYYQQNKKFPPAFVRRFFLRHPQAHLWIVFGLCSSAMVVPVLHSVYLYITMTPEEFDHYRHERSAVVKERQTFGKNLWIPFISSSEPTTEQKEESL